MMVLSFNGDAFFPVSSLVSISSKKSRSSQRNGARYKWRAPSCNAAWQQQQQQHSRQQKQQFFNIPSIEMALIIAHQNAISHPNAAVCGAINCHVH